MRWLQASLRAKLSLLVVVLFSTIAVLLGVLLPAQISAQGLESLESRSTSIAAVLASGLAAPVDFDDARAAQEVLKAVEAHPEVRWATVVGANGAVLASVDAARIPTGMGEDDGFTLLTEEAVVVATIRAASGATGRLTMGFSLQELQEGTREGRTFVLLVVGAVLLLGVAFAWFAGAVLVSPIRDVVDAARQVADGNVTGDLMHLSPSPNWRNSPDETEQLIGAVADMAAQMAQKIEAVKAAEQAAREGSEAKSAFLANMSHELRTPLNAVIGYSEILLDELDDPEHLEDLRRIRSAGAHLLGLINDILDLAKVEAGKVDVIIEEVLVEELIADVVATVQPGATSKNTTINVMLEDGLTIWSDGAKLRQILFNLATNAVKFTEGGVVTIIASRAGEQVAFAVKDNGIGIPEEKHHLLFRPFSQADASTTRKYGGTGLGLTLVRRLCQLLGGDVSVSSVGGQGSTFTASVRDQRPRLHTPLSEVERRASPFGPSVVVVDDDPAAADLMQRTLSKAGFRVLVANDGESGIALVQRVQPVAVVLDVLMPKMSGFEVMGALKADARTADIPVVFVTQVDDRAQGMALGAADYMCKPIDRDALIRAVHRFRPSGAPPRLLLVEDDAYTADVIGRTLHKDGWEVIRATNGREGLERIDPSISLVVLDLMMPEMDGFTFLELVRCMPAVADVPVVVVTARDLSDVEREQLERNVSRVIGKQGGVEDSLVREVRRAARRGDRRAPLSIAGAAPRPGVA